MNENELKRLIPELNRIFLQKFNVDLAGFKTSFLLRRLSIAIRRTGFKDLKEFTASVENNPRIAEKVFSILTISVSSFFRNREVFQFLGKIVTPLFSTGAPVRALSCGCAKGEEAYSTGALLLHSAGKEEKVKVVGIDISPENIEHATKGVYERQKWEDIPPVFRKFFRITSRGVEPGEKLRKIVSFRVANIVDFNPEEKFNIVLLRNVLIFMERDFQKKMLEAILRVLKKDGILVLGKVESLPKDFSDRFTPLNLSLRVYQLKKEEEV